MTNPWMRPILECNQSKHLNMWPILECNHLFLTFTHKTCQKICLAHILSYSIVYCITEEPFSFPFRPEPRAVLWSSRVSGWAAPSPVDSLYQMFQNKDCSWTFDMNNTILIEKDSVKWKATFSFLSCASLK